MKVAIWTLAGNRVKRCANGANNPRKIHEVGPLCGQCEFLSKDIFISGGAGQL